MNPNRNVISPDRMSSYSGSSYNPGGNYGYRKEPPMSWNDVPMRPPSTSRYQNNYMSDIDPGMNGDGWQGQGQPGGGRGGGGGHHMAGGRRGMHNSQQNRMPNQHHGAPHRMMGGPNNFRQQPQQQQQQQPYMFVGMPDMMDMNIMRMDGLSLNGGPPAPVLQQPNGMYGDMPPQPQWGQPQPFGVQEEMFDHGPPFGGPPQHSGMHNGPQQYGNSNRGGGYNRGMNQNNRQGGGYRPPQNNFPVPVPMPHQMPPQQHQSQNFYAPQQPFAQPFPSGQPMTPMDQMGSNGGGGPGGQGFSISTSTMDDYTMWQGDTDEDAKKKKVLRDKGLTAWGDAEASNSKPIRRWLVPEGQEEDLETAMTRCPQHQKKKTAQDESIRRRLNSDNPQVVQQAQQQVEDDRTAMVNVGKRPIVACGWGDLPAELAEKHDYDSMAKGWDSASSLNNGGGGRSQDDRDHPGMIGAWNSGASQSSSSERRNPFFAQHMQQQQQLDGNHVGMPYMDPSGSDNNGWLEPSQIQQPPMNMGQVPSSIPEPHDENRMKVAENLRYAVEKGHLDIKLLSLTHIPPNVLDLLTIILAKIPILDANNDSLQTIIASRPEQYEATDEPKLWLTNEQQVEYDKLVINVVTARIEVQDLSRKINRALAEAGLVPQLNNAGPPPLAGNIMPNSSSNMNAMGEGSSQQNRNDTFDGVPPDHCDYYDYSFLG